MLVVGRHTYIISDTGQVTDVSPFTPDYALMQLHIVDAVVKNDWPYNGEPYILAIRKILYVPSMSNNLLPPFIYVSH